jgi:hypothetical protein
MNIKVNEKTYVMAKNEFWKREDPKHLSSMRRSSCLLNFREVLHAVFRTARAVIAQSVQRLGYGVDGRGSRFRFPTWAGNFSLHHRVQRGSGPTQPPIQWVSVSLSLWVKRPGHKADHSPPSSVEVKE